MWSIINTHPTIFLICKFLPPQTRLLSKCLQQLMGLAKLLGGFHNVPSMLQASFSPGPLELWASGYGYRSNPRWGKQGCGLTVRQLLYGNCPPACPCPTVSFSAGSWGRLLSIWAGRRESGWAVKAAMVQRCAFTPWLASGSLCACPCLQAGSVPQHFLGKLPIAIK